MAPAIKGAPKNVTWAISPADIGLMTCAMFLPRLFRLAIAVRDSAGTIAIVYDCLVGTSISLQSSWSRKKPIATDKPFENAIPTNVKFAATCVKTMVLTSPILVANGDARATEVRFSNWAEKKIAESENRLTPN